MSASQVGADPFYILQRYFLPFGDRQRFRRFGLDLPLLPPGRIQLLPSGTGDTAYCRILFSFQRLPHHRPLRSAFGRTKRL